MCHLAAARSSLASRQWRERTYPADSSTVGPAQVNSFRPRAAHLARTCSYHAPQRDWTNDTEVELQEVLQLQHTGLDLISLHIYAHSDNYRFGKPPAYLLSIAAKAASAASTATMQKRVYQKDYRFDIN